MSHTSDDEPEVDIEQCLARADYFDKQPRQLTPLQEAAPDLLKACRKALELISRPFNDGVLETRRSLEVAISKAEGKRS